MKKILVIRFSSMGDLLLTTGPLKVVKQNHKDIKVDLLTSDMGREIFQGSHLVDRIHVISKGSSLMKVTQALNTLDSYDAVIDLQGNLKSRLAKFFVNGPYFLIEKQSRQRRAYVKNRKYKESLQKHVVQKYWQTFNKAFQSPEPTLEELRPIFHIKPAVLHENFRKDKPTVAIHPYASQRNKVWPYFDELIGEFLKKSWNVIVIGADPEPLKTKDHPQLMNLTNQTSFTEMAALLKSCQTLVSTDSGPMHLAVAVEIPTLALFGPTTREFGFYPNFKNCQVIEDNTLNCRPCHVHGGNKCPLGHRKCMTNLELAQVLNSVEVMVN